MLFSKKNERSHTSRLAHRLALTVILLLLGMNAIVAGYGFMGTPDGSAVGIPLDWLEDSPFKDYLIPGIVLFSLGCLHVVAGILVILERKHATMLALIAGGSMSFWIIVQAAMMGSFRHPAQTTLQAICLTLGIATVAMCLRRLRCVRESLHSHPSATPLDPQ